jgi:hypothetical protein
MENPAFPLNDNADPMSTQRNIKQLLRKPQSSTIAQQTGTRPWLSITCFRAIL